MPAFFTIGHSTRSVAELVELLQNAGVALLADVRTIPRSRTNPQFNLDALPAELAGYGIASSLGTASHTSIFPSSAAGAAARPIPPTTFGRTTAFAITPIMPGPKRSEPDWSG